MTTDGTNGTDNDYEDIYDNNYDDTATATFSLLLHLLHLG